MNLSYRLTEYKLIEALPGVFIVYLRAALC